jgi:hypothetical protein
VLAQLELSPRQTIALSSSQVRNLGSAQYRMAQLGPLSGEDLGYLGSARYTASQVVGLSSSMLRRLAHTRLTEDQVWNAEPDETSTLFGAS